MQLTHVIPGRGPRSSSVPGVYLYQLTETGLSASITVSGTKLFKDNDLN